MVLIHAMIFILLWMLHPILVIFFDIHILQCIICIIYANFCPQFCFQAAFNLYKLLLSLQAQERKAALRRIPEQAVLAEVRRMVEEMQTLNRKLDETVSIKKFVDL